MATAAPALAAHGGNSSGTKSRRDTAPPTVAISSPAGGSTISGNVSMTGTSSDNVAVAQVYVQIDSNGWQLATGTDAWSATVSTAGLTGGTHTLSAEAVDTSGNSTVTSETVSLDNSAPVVAISSPASGSAVNGTVSVTGTASDDTSVASVAVSVDGGAFSPATGTAQWSYAWDTTGLSAGTHTLTARATDAVGTAAESSVTVSVAAPSDPTPPSVTITSPTAGSTVSGTVTVSGSASDNVSVAQVSVSVDGGPWQPASGKTSWSYQWDTTTLSNGTHTIAAQASDAAGNVASTTSSVSVTNSSVAPNSQGTWVSPEGVTIIVNSSGPWTISQVYNLLRAQTVANSTTQATFLDIAPRYTIDVQDSQASMTSVSYSMTSGTYGNYRATTYLQGVNSTFSTWPDYVLAHEYGIAWSQYFWVMDHQTDWSVYLGNRADGSTYNGTYCAYLGQDPRLGSTQTWDEREIIADDYRLLFGSSAAISERPNSINTTIVDPRNQPGLDSWLLTTWG